MLPRRQRLWSLVPVLYFFALTTAATYPWFLRPGFLFLLDFVWTPRLPPASELLGSGLVTSVPHAALFQFLAEAVPTDLVQKVTLALPLFLSGLAAFHLSRFLVRDMHEPLRTALSYSTGTWYAVNVFVVTRMFFGHLYLLHAYALTPWALLAFLAFLKSPNVRRGLAAGCVAAATMLTNAHHFILVPLLLLVYGIVVGRRVRMSRATGAAMVLPVLVLLLVSATVLAWQADNLPTPNALGPWARALQAPYTGNLLLDTLFLTGTAKTDLPFVFPYETLSGFGFASALFVGTMVLGVARFWTDPAHGPLVRATTVVAVVSVFLAIGVAHPLTEPTSALLYRSFPPWLLLRDSAKFLALVALAETILLGYGIRALRTSALLSTRTALGAAGQAALPFALVGITLYLASPTFGGFQGQLLPSQYPESWAAWNQRLGKEIAPAPTGGPHFTPTGATRGRPRMLFLPWHQYLPFSFSDERTIANPAPAFFTNAEVISGDNSEVGGTDGRPFIYSESHRPLSKRLEAILKDAPARVDIGSRIALEGIRYVALATDSIDSASYDYLSRQVDLRPVFESPELTVWEVGLPKIPKTTVGP